MPLEYLRLCSSVHDGKRVLQEQDSFRSLRATLQQIQQQLEVEVDEGEVGGS